MLKNIALLSVLSATLVCQDLPKPSTLTPAQAAAPTVKVVSVTEVVNALKRNRRTFAIGCTTAALLGFLGRGYADEARKYAENNKGALLKQARAFVDALNSDTLPPMPKDEPIIGEDEAGAEEALKQTPSAEEKAA